MEQEPKPNKYNVQGINWGSKELLEQAKKRAASFDLSLSKYVNKLVERDVKEEVPTTSPMTIDSTHQGVMLTPQRLKHLVNRLPFQPLVVTMTSGEKVEIKHREEVWITPSYFQVVTEKSEDGIILSSTEVPFTHVASVQTVAMVDELKD
jgi:hypothetical protein